MLGVFFERGAAASESRFIRPFSKKVRVGMSVSARQQYVCRLYKQALKTSRDWVINVDQWRMEAVRIRDEFEKHREEQNPFVVNRLIGELEDRLADMSHPDPYRRRRFSFFRYPRLIFI